MYLIIDTMGDYKALADYKDIRDLLIEQICYDLKTNMSDETLATSMLNNLNILERLAREKDTPLSYIFEQLESYSFKVIDLLQIQRDLEDIKIYFENDNELEYTFKTDEVINIINKELCKNGK